MTMPFRPKTAAVLTALSCFCHLLLTDALIVPSSTSLLQRPLFTTARTTTPLSSASSESASSSPESIRIGIAGAGAISFATATLLNQRGHDPMLWSPSGSGTSELSEETPLTSTGAIESTFRPRIATSARQLVEENSVIFIALPANGHKSVINSIAPHLRSDQTVIISSHSSLGAVYLTRLLSQRNITIPIIAWGTTAVTARKPTGTTTQVCTIRSQIDICTVPESRSSVGLRLCQTLFGDDRFKQRDGLLAISLSNLNAQNHLGIVLGNMSRMERGEAWSQGLNITPNVGRLLEALDRERLEIADALKLNVRTIFEHFHLSFHVPISSVSEMNYNMVQKGNDVNGPATADSRYVTEDVPYGLTLIVELGKMVGREAVLHEAGIKIVSAMYGRDFEKENELLEALELEKFDIEDLKEASRSGMLPKKEEEMKEGAKL